MPRKAKPAQDAEVKSKPAQDAEVAERKSVKTHYEQWKVELKDGKAEKLKIVRPRVLISDEQAEILNEGVLKGGNNIGDMYFLPE